MGMTEVVIRVRTLKVDIKQTRGLLRSGRPWFWKNLKEEEEEAIAQRRNKERGKEKNARKK